MATHDTTRRALFAGAAALAGVAALPVSAGTVAGAEFVRWERERDRLSDAGSAASQASEAAGGSIAGQDAAGEVYFSRRDRFEDAIFVTPPSDRLGAVVKLRVALQSLDFGARYDETDKACVEQVIAWLQAH